MLVRMFYLIFYLFSCFSHLVAEPFNATITPLNEKITTNLDSQITSVEYGVVGTMIDANLMFKAFLKQNPRLNKLELLTPQVMTEMFSSLNWPDPCPGYPKQLVLSTRDNKVLVFYEECKRFSHRSDFSIPIENFDKFETIVLYCHTVGYSEGADENYNFFVDYGIPDDPSTLVCLIYNHLDNPPVNPTQSMSGNILKLHRHNLGYDFGAWSDAIQCLKLDKRKKGFKLLLINDTVRGPFVHWFHQKNSNCSWTKIFTDMITEEVKLVGTTINICPDPKLYGSWAPHVQSMLLATDEVGFAIGVKGGVFTINNDKFNVTNRCEVGFSREIIASGFNLDCLAPVIHGYDFRSPEKCLLRSGDVQYEGAYFGTSLNPYDVVFFKTNRGISENQLKIATYSKKTALIKQHRVN